MPKLNVVCKKLVLVFLMFLLFCAPVVINAQQTMPDLEEREDSLLIRMVYDANGNKKAIDGSKISIARVADVKITNGSVDYIPLDTYSSLNLDFEGMNTSISLLDAKNILAYHLASDIPSQSGVTNKSGEVRFSKLRHGIYLVWQSGSTGTAAKFENIDPFLVLVPEISEKYSWIYDVIASPKTQLKQKPSPPTTPTEPKPKPPEPSKKINVPVPRTGESFSLTGYLLIVIACVIFTLRHCMISKHQEQRD